MGQPPEIAIFRAPKSISRRNKSDGLMMRYPIDGDLMSLLTICCCMGHMVGVLGGLAGSGAEPGSQSMGFHGLKLNIVEAALNFRFGNKFA